MRLDHTLIASNRVEGTRVYNRAGERIGTVDHLMIDKKTGQVAYAVMSFGGFLGVGEKSHPLPWSALDYETAVEGYVVDINRERLEGAPSFPPDNTPPWSDPDYQRSLDLYWGSNYS